MIIIEGMDNTGKTTLISRIVNKFPQLELIKSPGPDQADQPTWIRNELQKTNQRVYDRFPLISEEIYGPEIRGYSALGDNWSPLWTELIKQDPLIIYCRPPRDVILKTLYDREQMEGVTSHSRNLINLYDSFFRRYVQDRTRLRVYNFVEDPMGHEILKVIEEELK